MLKTIKTAAIDLSQAIIRSENKPDGIISNPRHNGRGEPVVLIKQGGNVRLNKGQFAAPLGKLDELRLNPHTLVTKLREKLTQLKEVQVLDIIKSGLVQPDQLNKLVKGNWYLLIENGNQVGTPIKFKYITSGNQDTGQMLWFDVVNGFDMHFTNYLMLGKAPADINIKMVNLPKSFISTK